MLQNYNVHYGDGKQRLEKKLASLMKQGVNKDEAIRLLALKEKLIGKE